MICCIFTQLLWTSLSEERSKAGMERRADSDKILTIVNSCIWVPKNLTIQGLEVFLGSSRLAPNMKRAEPVHLG